MHSSRMRTARSLIVFPGSLSLEGGDFWGDGGLGQGVGCPLPLPGPEHLPHDHVTYPMMYLVSSPSSLDRQMPVRT